MPVVTACICRSVFRGWEAQAEDLSAALAVPPILDPGLLLVGDATEASGVGAGHHRRPIQNRGLGHCGSILSATTRPHHRPGPKHIWTDGTVYRLELLSTLVGYRSLNATSAVTHSVINTCIRVQHFS